VVNDCFNLLAISMMKKEKNSFLFFFFFIFRSFIRRNVRQIIFNNRWLQEKKQQIAFFGIECNIYIQMIIHYLNTIQVNVYFILDQLSQHGFIFRLVYTIESSSSTSYASSFTISTWKSFSFTSTIINKWCRWNFNTSAIT